jgi:hypothetical protein
MTQQVRVYVYDIPSRFNTDLVTASLSRWDRCDEFMFRAERTLHHNLLASASRTTNVSEADFFFVPVYLACALTHRSQNDVSDLLLDLWHYLSVTHTDIIKTRSVVHMITIVEYLHAGCIIMSGR